MTGIINTFPPITELPPGSASGPANLPPITYQYAVLGLAQTWAAPQSFPSGMFLLPGSTPHGVLLGEGPGAVVSTAALTDGQLLVGQTGADPLPKTISGDVAFSAAGAATIQANAVTNAKIAAMPARTFKANLTALSAIPSDATTEQILSLVGGGGFIRMWPSSTQGVGAWNLLDPWGNTISASTSQGLTAALAAWKASNWPLVVFGQGTITLSAALTIPSNFFGNLYIGPEVTIAGGVFGTSPVVTIDSQENSVIRMLCQFTQNSTDTGDLILLKPTNAGGPGGIVMAASVLDFGVIAPASAGASAIHADTVNGNIDGCNISVVDINGGVAGFKVTISAATPHVFQENIIDGAYWHGFSAFGMQFGTSSTNANFIRRNISKVGRIAPNNNAAVGISSFGAAGDIFDVGGISAEEAPGGANIAAGIIWQSGASGNYARVAGMATGTGPNVTNSSGNTSNVTRVAGALVGGTIDGAAIGATTASTGKFTTLTLSGTGGASQFLKQASVGAAVTVVQPGAADLSDYATAQTWAPTFGGFSVAPTGGTAVYTRVGKLVLAYFNGWSAGTSNATTKTVTLPLPSRAAVVMAGMGHPFDNGAFLNAPCRIDTRAGSATADIYKDLNTTAWTNSGSCVFDFALVYEAA